MDKKSLTFTVSKKVADMFSLATALMDKDENEVFEELAKRYATEVLQRTPNLANHPRKVISSPFPLQAIRLIMSLLVKRKRKYPFGRVD